VHPRYVPVVLKRLFYRAANLVAGRVGADAIVTGEAIGQVSSQTVKNLRAIDEVAELPVFRPLIAHDKEDIITLARKIGTVDLSAKVQEFCHLVKSKPVTACPASQAECEEMKVNLELVTAAAAHAKPIDLTTLSIDSLRGEFLRVDSIPDGATVIDLRNSDEFSRDHHPMAENHDFARLCVRFRELDKSKVYVVCCPHGTMSGIVAEKMQSEGYLAYSLRGGLATTNRDGRSTQ
jgi:thiamine biosynthesis protein ThiI